jgi:ParB family chromosome partitioning protein
LASKNKKLSIAVDLLSNDISGVVRKIPLDKITPTKDQPRVNKDINIEKLSKSLTEEGLLQPIVVTKNGENGFSIIAGERRYRAAKMAGWEEIECKILSANIIDTYKFAVIENIQRENLNPIEEAFAYRKLKNMFSYTDLQLSEVIGKSRNYISEILSISEIPKETLKKAEDLGIRSRNILVQLAQAVKNKCENDFLLNFQNGNINSVKNAKYFLKQIKTNNKSNTASKETAKIQPNIFIQTVSSTPDSVHIEIKINNLSGFNANSEKLEKIIHKQIFQFLLKNTSR